jgi:hypothetical protein
MQDVWVWDIYRTDRFVKTVKVLTFKDVNLEGLSGKACEIPKELAVGEQSLTLQFIEVIAPLSWIQSFCGSGLGNLAECRNLTNQKSAQPPQSTLVAQYQKQQGNCLVVTAKIAPATI